jgi:LysM repeat protein
MKSGVGAGLKDNPKKSIAAALAAVAAAGSQIGGGQGQRNGPTADQMATANGATPSTGTTPAAVNPDAAGKTDSSKTYQIQRGDVLSRIAQQNGVSVAELMAANPSIKNPNKITAGATITIPPASGKPTYDQGVGSKPVVKPADSSSDQAERDDAAKVDADEAKKKAEIEATQKEIDTMKAQLAALIIDLEKSEDEDNIRQLKDLESQLDDLDDIKALNATNPSASNYTNQMDQASDAASATPAPKSEIDQQIEKDKENPQNNPGAASLANAPGSKAATTPVSEPKLDTLTKTVKETDELARWLKIANIK